MRYVAVFFVICMFIVGTSVNAQTEEEIVQKYLKKTEQKHTQKLSWISVNFSVDRINRSSSYNDFATLVSRHFTNTSIPGLDKATAFGFDMGVVMQNRFAWTFGGEYWLKMGTNQSGSFTYDPPNGTPTTVTNLVSEITTYGINTGLKYYITNPPQPQKPVKDISFHIGGTVGYYWTNWDLWQEFENLNLATSTPVPENTTFKGSAPSFSLGFGVDYPLNFLDLALGADFSYLYLNFTNVAWYNSQDEEIVITYDGTADSRVDLDLSGFRGKIEVKRYFHW